MKILKFKEFLNEGVNRSDLRDLPPEGDREKTVYDLAEETLLTKDIIIICEDDDDFEKLKQIISVQEKELILQITGNVLYHLKTPFEFLQWDIIGSSTDEIIETCFMIKEEDQDKI